MPDAGLESGLGGLGTPVGNTRFDVFIPPNAVRTKPAKTAGAWQRPAGKRPGTFREVSAMAGISPNPGKPGQPALKTAKPAPPPTANTGNLEPVSAQTP